MLQAWQASHAECLVDNARKATSIKELEKANEPQVTLLATLRRELGEMSRTEVSLRADLQHCKLRRGELRPCVALINPPHNKPFDAQRMNEWVDKMIRDGKFTRTMQGTHVGGSLRMNYITRSSMEDFEGSYFSNWFDHSFRPFLGSYVLRVPLTKELLNAWDGSIGVQLLVSGADPDDRTLTLDLRERAKQPWTHGAWHRDFDDDRGTSITILLGLSDDDFVDVWDPDAEDEAHRIDLDQGDMVLCTNATVHRGCGDKEQKKDPKGKKKKRKARARLPRRRWFMSLDWMVPISGDNGGGNIHLLDEDPALKASYRPPKIYNLETLEEGMACMQSRMLELAH